MPPKNDERHEETMMWGYLGFAILMLGLVLAFAALIGTVLCLFAMLERRELFGIVVEPHEATSYVRCGVVGAVLTFLFFVFIEILFPAQVPPESVPFMFMGGYTLGFFLRVLAVQAEKEKAKAETILPASHKIEVMPEPALRTGARRAYEPKSKTFRYASWEDEEGQ